MFTLNRLCIASLLAACSLFSSMTVAEQSVSFANLQVHYIALPTTFLQPEIAQQYDIKRSKFTALINISILDENDNLKAVAAQLSGTGKNLIGQIETLNFNEIREGDAIYYIATYPFSNEEIVNFSIAIKNDNTTNTLKFQHKFYTE